MEMFHNRAHAPLCCTRIPSWMTPEQRRQLLAYVAGQEIPTDRELVEGLVTYDTSRHTRFRQWAYSNLAGCLEGAQWYTYWCELIRTYATDPDLMVDEGL